MKGTILLVDDNKLFIEIEKEYLSHSAIDVFTAANGIEALTVVQSRRPDIIFIDLQMPKMDGATCCRKIKANPDFKTIPVVMVTAQGNEDDKNTCLSAGCDSFLTKPLDRDQFLDAARRFLPSIERREKRYPVRIAAACRANEATFSCTMVDISIGGAFLVSENAGLPEGIIQITFALPDGTIIDTPGRVARVNRVATTQMPKGFGVKFALMPKYLRESLENFIETAQ
jgi:CheY-like chemotaxis protein